jgi:hypothetical protein
MANQEDNSLEKWHRVPNYRSKLQNTNTFEARATESNHYLFIFLNHQIVRWLLQKKKNTDRSV